MVQDRYKDFGGNDISEDSNLKNRENKTKTEQFQQWQQLQACSETFNSNMDSTDKLPWHPPTSSVPTVVEVNGWH